MLLHALVILVQMEFAKGMQEEYNVEVEFVRILMENQRMNVIIIKLDV